jgi:lipopolysaccharide biosynthesis glycosyltransferase
VQDLKTFAKPNVVAVVNIGRGETFKYCLKSIENYCKKYGFALEIMENVKYNIQGNDNYNYLTFEKNQIYELFGKYDRILRVDSDVLITPICPNMFDIVPREKVGAVYEDVGSRKENRRKRIREVKEALGDVDWESGYFNSGVLVVSNEHKELFRITERDIQTIKDLKIIWSKEQTFLNYRVRMYGFEVHALDFRFNHTRIFSEKWNRKANRLKSFIIHYAGPQNVKLRMIRRDYGRVFRAQRKWIADPT